MNQQSFFTNQPSSSRRAFHAATCTGLGAVVTTSSLARMVHASDDDTIKVGLIGCGGRGSGAAIEALQADRNVRLVAMGDAFGDRLQMSLKAIQRKPEIAAKIDVPIERQFVGFDAYQRVIDSGVDVVLLATPPHFRPMHLKAAVAAGKHVFAEKPCAVDTAGVKSVLQSCDEARKKQLSIVSGLCLRYHQPYRAAISRIHDGTLGQVTTLMANDYRGPIWVKPRKPEWSDMEWQMQNWYYFTWLSGDFNVEQHIHNLDVCVWAMGNRYPTKAIGMGGREVRKTPEYGNIFDHHSVVYEYEDGARLISNTRQMQDCKSDISVHILGTRGSALLTEGSKGVHVRSDSNWTYTGEEKSCYQIEHDELFASIRSGQPINNGEYMAKSTLLAIMGRMATYTGQEISWDMAWNSKEDLTPPSYEWGPLQTPAVAIPGQTRFI